MITGCRGNQTRDERDQGGGVVVALASYSSSDSPRQKLAPSSEFTSNPSKMMVDGWTPNGLETGASHSIVLDYSNLWMTI